MVVRADDPSALGQGVGPEMVAPAATVDPGAAAGSGMETEGSSGVDGVPGRVLAVDAGPVAVVLVSFLRFTKKATATKSTTIPPTMAMFR